MLITHISKVKDFDIQTEEKNYYAFYDKIFL